jgi:hypothetical protein
MLRVLILAVLGAFAAAFPALAADIYTGTIGTAQVVVVLKRTGTAVEGSYAYRSVGHPITLTGVAARGTLDIRETIEGGQDAAEPVVTGLWRLTPQGTGMTGTWRARAGAAARPISLTRIATTPPDPTEPPPGWVARNVTAMGEGGGWARETLPFLVELARTPVRQGAEQRIGVGAFRMVTDPRSGVAWPQLTQFPDAAAMQRMNTVFEENRALEIAEVWSCADSLYALDGHRGGPDHATNRITFMSRRLIALNIEGSMNCGGAHPSNVSFSATYDTQTGRVFDTDRLLKLDSEAEQAAFRRFWRQRYAVARRAGRTSYPADCPNPASEEDPVTVGYTPTPRGLAVGYVSQASVDAACGVTLVELPLADVTPFLRPGATDYWR